MPYLKLWSLDSPSQFLLALGVNISRTPSSPSLWAGHVEDAIFKTGQKMETKFGQFKKLKCSNFVNSPNFVTIFTLEHGPPPVHNSGQVMWKMLERKPRSRLGKLCIAQTHEQVETGGDVATHLGIDPAPYPTFYPLSCNRLVMGV